MKQFSLTEYLKNPNRKVVTREGAGVRIICTDRIRTYLDKDYPILGLVKNRFDGSEMVAGFKSNGESKDKNWDLFFDPEQKACPFKKEDIDTLAETIEGVDLLRHNQSLVWSCSRYNDGRYWFANGHSGYSFGGYFHYSLLTVPIVLHR